MELRSVRLLRCKLPLSLLQRRQKVAFAFVIYSPSCFGVSTKPWKIRMVNPLDILTVFFPLRMLIRLLLAMK
ncbi:hypothetical protein KR52_05245 [Synechococcus sp. KORDI-52]|nr:hypothetical protein KR52_05245 [Synechococcus sp. KORDI-52]